MSILSPAGYVYGTPRLSSPANPGAGNPLVLTVPNGMVWRPRAITVGFGTSAVVITRTPHVTLADAAGFFYARDIHLNGLGAGIGAAFFFQLGPVSGAASALSNVAGLPDALMLAGHTLTVSAINLQAGDSFIDARFHYEEFLV